MINNLLIDILPISLLIIFGVGLKLFTPKGLLNKDGYLSIYTTKSLRGLLSIIIIFHHLSQLTNAGYLFRGFSYIGYLVVAIFFFISGFGLQKSYIIKKDEYKKGFLTKRIPNVLFPYIIISFIYWVLYYFVGETYSLKDALLSFINGKPIALYSWYIISIIILYFVYWALMLICRNRYNLMVILGFVFYGLYLLFCYCMNYGFWWYNTGYLFVFGIAWAIYENKILKVLEKVYFYITPICVILLAFLLIKNSNAVVIPKSLIFVFCFLLFSLKFKIGNKMLAFLGGISLELYLSQGLFIKLFRSNVIFVKNSFLYCLAVIFGTVIFSFVFNKMSQFILTKYKALLKK